MKRIDTTTKAVDLFGTGKHGYRDGDKVLGIPATALNASIFNALQEEMATVIEATGTALNGADNTQLYTAIMNLLSGSLDYKASVRIASTANIASLSGLAVIDGVAPIAGDRILLKDQTTGSQNGIYIAAAGAWTRATDADTGAEFNSGAAVSVEEGSVNLDSVWMITNNGPVTIGTTALVFARKDSAVATIPGLFKNLKIDAIGINNYNCVITADQVVLANSAGQYISVSSVNKTVNANGAVGAPLSIMTARAAAAWYYRWLWYSAANGLTATLDASSTAPTTPAGYASTDYKALLPGASRTDASGSTYLVQLSTRNNKSQYIVLAASNTANLPIMATGAQGNVSTPTWVAINASAAGASSVVPVTASQIKIVATAVGSNVVVLAAPNNAYGGYGSMTNPAPLCAALGTSGGQPNTPGEFMLESTNIYCAMSSGTLACIGWES